MTKVFNFLKSKHPIFAIDHITPNKQYDDDYTVMLSSSALLIVFDSESFEKTASEHTNLYRFCIKEKTRLTTHMGLSYSAFIAPTGFLRVARWLRFCAGNIILRGLDPIIENKSQQKMAQLLGISRTTLTSAIRVLRESGAIDTRYRKIRIDIEKLNETIADAERQVSSQDL